MPDLKPANENPWYVLATLYGEQDGETIDRDLHEKNRRAWNAWAGQALSEEEQEAAAITSQIDVAELRAWPEMQEEVCARYKARKSKRIGKAQKIPPPSTGINFSNTIFSHTVVWEKMVFSAAAGFDSATFSSAAWFDSATFSSAALFNAATFNAAAWFNSATFNAAAGFISATFNAGARFNSATFNAAAWFNSATFNAAAVFNSASFNADAWFNSATFSADAWFNSATFSGPCKFNETKFGHPRGGDHEEGHCVVLFQDAVFEKPMNFREAKFYSHYPDLTGAVLHENVVLSAESDYWPQITQNAPEQAKASCEALRHVVAKQGQVEAERFFFNREMQFTSEVEAKKLQKRFGRFWRLVSPHWWYGFISDFGQSIFRPAAALFCVWLAGVVCFLAHYEWQKSMAGQDYSTGLPWGLSFTNLFSFLGMGRRFFGAAFYVNLPHWMVFISGAQTILGVILLFFLGLGLRNRFRLK